MPLKRFHVVVVEASTPRVVIPEHITPESKIEFLSVPPVLDINVDVQDSFRDNEGVETPMSLQLQIRAALEAARPSLYEAPCRSRRARRLTTSSTTPRSQTSC